MMRRLANALLLASLVPAAGCGTAPPMGATPLAPTDPKALLRTLEDLAAFGEKHVGTEAGQKAGEYVRGRLQAAKLGDLHMESFATPRYDRVSSSLAVTIAGAASKPGFDVFEFSGSGHAEGNVVYVGVGSEVDLMPLDLTGKIALVDRTALYHRSTQYRNVTAKGAAAMLYVSDAPDNLRQVGTVRLTWSSPSTIPAITIGKLDGAMIREAVVAKKAVTATIDVLSKLTPATGNNVVATLPGKDAGQIVIGAHYDSWFIGSTDNGGGVAALLALAERRMLRQKPRYTLVFVGYDGEEVGLLGGYDYLRKHRIVAKDPILAVLNFEVPSAKMAGLQGLGRSNQAALDEALKGADLGVLYPFYGPLDAIPKLFGGIIPTDIQGIYRNGVPTASTAVVPPYYHTTADTPDKVDTAMLAEVVDAFDAAIETLCATEPVRFAEKDPKIWTAVATLAPRAAGAPAVVLATITNSDGVPQASAPIAADLLVDDFTFAARVTGTTDAQGRATLTLPGPATAMGAGARFIHVTSGPDYPLVEQIVPLP